jgi:hypothetical protein
MRYIIFYPEPSFIIFSPHRPVYSWKSMKKMNLKETYPKGWNTSGHPGIMLPH